MANGAPIGLVLEGPTEYEAIPWLLTKIGIRFVTPSVINGQPTNVPVKALVEGRLLAHVRAQIRKTKGRVVVVLDRENRSESAADFGKSVQRELLAQLKKVGDRNAVSRIFVCIADSRFENWLLSDPAGLEQSRLIRRRSNVASRVACHADNRNALELLRNLIAKGWYSKAIHGPQLAKHIRVSDPRHKYCSKSFEAFLRTVRGA